jgi:hypothetical protein
MNCFPMNRRELLGSFGMGFGGLALAEMAPREAVACSAASTIRPRRSG